MPTNLNALIRYKTIDQCLQNQYRKHTIKDLIDKCSDALAESRGRTENVAERTIREDIRVMRSEILGFNAPIEQKDGNYFYSESDYSIFNSNITEKKLLSSVFDLLIDEKDRINGSEFKRIIMELARITGNKIPQEVFAKEPLKVTAIKRTQATAAKKTIAPSSIKSDSDDMPDFDSHEEPLLLSSAGHELGDPESQETPIIDDGTLSEIYASSDIESAIGYNEPENEKPGSMKQKKKFSIRNLFRKSQEQLDAPYKWDNIFQLLK